VKSDLLIDHWVESHDKNDQLIETFKGKIKMSEVTEQKYLGFVISSDGSNTNNIEAKKKRAIGITKHIQYLIKDLGKFTIECGIIYLNSLLRSSILFAAEAMYDIKENDFRHIEMIEEDLLKKLFKTGKGCTIFQLYFEAGQIPARIAIKRMKIVFFRYILTQKEDSILFKFLMAQKNEPRKGDWYSDVKKYLTEFEIQISEKYIQKMPAEPFKALVKKQAIKASIIFLKEKQNNCEKGSDINYQDFELQDYLSPSSNLSLEDQQIIFSLRSKMYPLKINFSRNENIKEVFFVSNHVSS
jgi:hypothetical protein